MTLRAAPSQQQVSECSVTGEEGSLSQLKSSLFLSSLEFTDLKRLFRDSLVSFRASDSLQFKNEASVKSDLAVFLMMVKVKRKTCHFVQRLLSVGVVSTADIHPHSAALPPRLVDAAGARLSCGEGRSHPGLQRTTN